VTAGSWFSKKNRIVKLTDDRILILNIKDEQLKYNNKYEDCFGVTKCLRIGARNFIVHFKTRGDEEWLSDKREEIIKAISEKYKIAENKML